MLDLRLEKLPCDYSATLRVGDMLGSLVERASADARECADAACESLVFPGDGDAAEGEDSNALCKDGNIGRPVDNLESKLPEGKEVKSRCPTKIASFRCFTV